MCLDYPVIKKPLLQEVVRAVQPIRNYYISTSGVLDTTVFYRAKRKQMYKP